MLKTAEFLAPEFARLSSFESENSYAKRVQVCDLSGVAIASNRLQSGSRSPTGFVNDAETAHGLA